MLSSQEYKEKYGFSRPELMCVCIARELKNYDNETIVVGTGFPLVGTVLGKLLYAPHLTILTESGIVDARPKRAPVGISDPCLIPGCAATSSFVDFMGALQRGLIKLSILSGAQVDKYGNINTSVIGNWHTPKVRLTGSGGSNPIATMTRVIITLPSHEKSRTPERVDFITSPGYIDGPKGREKYGLPKDTGPLMIISNKCVLRFDETTKEAYLYSVHPGFTVEDIKEATGWNLKIPSNVKETSPPTEEELKVLREKADPFGMIRIYEGRGY